MTAERRNHPRQEYAGDVGVIVDGQRHHCLVQDVSATGMRFKSAWRPEVGATVDLQFDGVQPLRGQVVRHTPDGFSVVSVWNMQRAGGARPEPGP